MMVSNDLSVSTFIQMNMYIRWLILTTMLQYTEANCALNQLTNAGLCLCDSVTGHFVLEIS